MRGVDVYLEIGRAVAVYIAPEEMTGVSEFSRHAMKALSADEVKGLIEPGACVGVDTMEVDLVVLQMIEVGDHVAIGADGAFDRTVEHEFVERLRVTVPRVRNRPFRHSLSSDLQNHRVSLTLRNFG
jgi:hypothetical protein